MKFTTHTIKRPDWHNYPVLQEGKYTTPFIYKKAKKVSIEISVGMQAGHAVAGYLYGIIGTGEGCCGGGCNPGRKWGEFRTLDDAELYGLRHVWRRLLRAREEHPAVAVKVNAALRAMEAKIAVLAKGEQLLLGFVEQP